MFLLYFIASSYTTKGGALVDQPTTEKDKCVICGKETPYTKDTHIDFRMYYIEGCGQLCIECGRKTEREE